eukprot:TRINITY_DN107401_c0_g1_i1.p1 TRINITY_DN107401_c0_g1~~TRINITY_DN107401_c0_g1_i1.p1  ORF type:complete len:709 (-),score=155.67 TRINITY_DN107401_c0_g1_i1:241-2076(-)
MSQEQRDFHRTLKEDRSDFSSTITEATELLTRGHGAGYISPNSIVVKAKGPDLPDLTLIDLPGLVAATGEGESGQMITEIRDMIHKHISSPRAVILCVLPANNDFHNSSILTMAKDPACDKDGIRTIGIITKPDLADKGSESNVLQLAQNTKARLELGWHTVKLRSQQDLQTRSLQEAEQAEELFFETDPWQALDKESVGIPKLRERLQELLFRRVQAELPKVSEEALQRLKATEAELSRMGVKCDETSKKRLVFAAAVGQCHSLLEDASAGRYIGTFFEKSEPEHANNLRAIIFEMEHTFRNDILKTRSKCLGEYDVGDRVWWKMVEGGEALEAEITWKGVNKFTLKVGAASHDNIDPDRLIPDRRELLDMLARMRADSLPGFESDVIFKQLMSRKLQPWENPAGRLQAETVKILKEVASRAVTFTVPAHLPSLRAYLQDQILQAIEEAADKLDRRVKEVLETEQKRPYTQNHYYSDLLMKFRTQQLTQKLAKLKDFQGKVDFNAMMGVLSAFGVGQASVEESAAIEIEFRLAAYLKVASKRFIDEVPKLVNTILVLPVVEAVKLLQTQVTDVQLDAIVAETHTAKRKRAELENDVKVLSDAVKVLKRSV